MNKKHFLKEPKVALWKKNIVDSGCKIYKINPLCLIHKKNGELLFALCETKIKDKDNKVLPKYIFIRGHAVIIIPLIINIKTRENRFLMIKQRRIGNGKVNLEFPAGMLDRNINNIKETAKKEFFEETGLTIFKKDLFLLHDGPLYSSPGASDEGIFYYGCIITVSDKEFSSLEGRRTGSSLEGENIVVTLKTKNQIISETTSLQARLGLYLFEDYVKKNCQNIKIT